MGTSIDGVRRAWRDLPLAAKGTIVIGAPILVLIVGFGILSATALQERSARQQLADTIKVRAGLSLLLRDLFAAESSARASVLSHREELPLRSLRARQQAIDDFNRLFESVPQNLRRDPVFESLRPLVAQELKATEALSAAASNADVAVEPLLLHSVGVTQKLHEKVLMLDSEEERKERIELAELDRVHDRTVAAGSFALSVGLLVSIGSMVFFALITAIRPLGTRILAE